MRGYNHYSNLTTKEYSTLKLNLKNILRRSDVAMSPGSIFLSSGIQLHLSSMWPSKKGVILYTTVTAF